MNMNMITNEDNEYKEDLKIFLKENRIQITTKEDAESLKSFFKETKRIKGNEMELTSLFNYYSINGPYYSLRSFYRALGFSKESLTTLTNTLEKYNMKFNIDYNLFINNKLFCFDEYYNEELRIFLKEKNITFISKVEAEYLQTFFKENKKVEGNEIDLANLFNYYSINKLGYSFKPFSFKPFYRVVEFEYSNESVDTLLNTIQKKGMEYNNYHGFFVRQNTLEKVQ